MDNQPWPCDGRCSTPPDDLAATLDAVFGPGQRNFQPTPTPAPAPTAAEVRDWMEATVLSLDAEQRLAQLAAHRWWQRFVCGCLLGAGLTLLLLGLGGLALIGFLASR